MNRSLYIFTIFFSFLLVAAGIFHSYLQFQLGVHMFGLESFVEWYVLMILILVIASFLTLKYYHAKKYRFSLIAGTMALFFGISHFTVVYFILAFGQLGNLFPVTASFHILIGLIYGVSLVVLPTGERPWLRAAGFIMVLLYLILGMAFGWGMIDQSPQTQTILENINKWTTLTGNLLPILFIINFRNELNALPKEQGVLNRPIVNTLLGISGLAALLAVLILGSTINIERYQVYDWLKNRTERAVQLAEPFDAKVFVNSQKDSLNYRLLKPLNYDSATTYPLVVCLHGGGGRGTDNLMQLDGSWSAQLLSEPYNRERYPAFVLVPQCPPGTSWGGIPNLPAVDSLVFEAINALEKEFKIDTNRRYVMGGSLGGYGSWHFISLHPEMFAAAVPVCGGGNPGAASKIADVPVWAFHGQEDRSVPVSESRRMIEAIKNAGGNPKYTEFPDEGHIIHQSVKKTPGLLDWVFAQKRI